MHEANHDRTHRSRTSASVGRSVCVPTLTGVDRCPHPIGPIRADMSSYVRGPSTAAEMHNHAWASGPANVRNCRDHCESWRRIEGVLTIRRVPDHPHPRADRHVHERGLLAKPHHHGLRRRSGRPGSGQGRVRPAPPGQSCRAAVTGRPVRPRPARTRSTAGRCRLLPAPELDRVDRRPLCGDPYRGDQQPLILIYRERKLGFMLGLARSTGLVVPSEFRVSITPE